MPFASVKLKPGVDVEATPALNEAGISACDKIRFKSGLPQKLGGWTALAGGAVVGVPRALHAWKDLGNTSRLAIGTTTRLDVLASAALSDITPQTKTTAGSITIASTAGSRDFQITDAGISNVTTDDAVFLNIPVSCGGVILRGLYQITSIVGTTNYKITAASAATETRVGRSASTVTISIASPAVVTWNSHGLPVGQPVAFGTTGALPTGISTGAGATYYVIAAGLGANSFQFSATPGGSAVITSGSQSGTHNCTAFGAEIPLFTTTSGSSSVTVTLTGHGLSAGSRFTFPASTTVGGLTIVGTYLVQSITDANRFTINLDAQASSSAVAYVRNGSMQYVYYISLGPTAAGAGFGLGGFGDGGFGTGVVPAAQTGTPISATNWSHDNWGELLLSCPSGGGVYYWAPNRGFQTAYLVPTAPIFNGGIFVAMPEQILVCWGSTAAAPGSTSTTASPEQRDPLQIRWSDIEDFTTFTPAATNQAGGKRISSGSAIINAIQGPQQALVWTDIDLHAMHYIGYPEVFGFNKIADGCGLIAQHAVAVMRGVVAWMGLGGFFALSGGTVTPMPCSVWDAVFQDLDTANASKITAGANSTFGEFWWFYPSLSGGTGEPDKYVKVNLLEGGAWDYGSLARSAWIDQSVLGQPIGASPGGIVYQHETGTDDGIGNPMRAWFETGWFVLAEGQQFVSVDQIVPDMKWGPFGGAQSGQLNVTVYATDYPNGPVRTYGPFLMTAARTLINTRLRGRLIKLRVESNDVGSTWRLGNLRYRAAPDGRR